MPNARSKRKAFIPAKEVYYAIDGEGLAVKRLLASLGIPDTQRCPKCGELLNDYAIFRQDKNRVRWRCSNDGYRGTFQRDE